MPIVELSKRYVRQRPLGLAHRAYGAALESRAFLRHMLSKKYACEKKFIVLGSLGRSGSTLLVELIDSLDTVTCQGELFLHPLLFPKRYIDNHYARCAAQAFGFKLLANQLDTIQKMDDPFAFLLQLVAEGYRIIHVRRENVIKRSLSSLHAQASHEFHSRTRRVLAERPKLVVDVDKLLSSLRKPGQGVALAERFLRQVPSLDIVYERDLEPSERHADTIRRVADFLEVPFNPPQTTLEKRLPSSIPDIVENYDELAAALKGTEYEVYLDS